MEIIRFAELRSEPWRNGGGVTRELASHPKAASAQDGAWDGLTVLPLEAALDGVDESYEIRVPGRPQTVVPVTHPR